MKKVKPIKIEEWANLSTQKFTSGKEEWLISNLISLTSELPIQEMPLEHLNIYNLYPKINSTRDFVTHIKGVLKADLTCPIILDDEGYVMDGRHRIAKALLEEHKTIKFVRFEKTPRPDFIRSG